MPSFPSSFADRRPSGFTLVELVGVLAVLLVLATLVLSALPAVFRSRERVQCTANLRQLHLEMLQYAADNRGRLVAPFDDESWWAVLGRLKKPVYNASSPEDNQVYRCPAAAHTYPNGNALRTYAMNAEGVAQEEGVRLAACSQPATALFIIDMKSQSDASAHAPVRFRSTASPRFSEYVDPRHGGRFNALFLDGHVESLSPDDPNIPAMIQRWAK